MPFDEQPPNKSNKQTWDMVCYVSNDWDLVGLYEANNPVQVLVRYVCRRDAKLLNKELFGRKNDS